MERTSTRRIRVFCVLRKTHTLEMVRVFRPLPSLFGRLQRESCRLLVFWDLLLYKIIIKLLQHKRHLHGTQSKYIKSILQSVCAWTTRSHIHMTICLGFAQEPQVAIVGRCGIRSDMIFDILGPGPYTMHRLKESSRPCLAPNHSA